MAVLLDPGISEVDGGPVTLETSVFAQLEKSLKSNPDSTAIIVAHQRANHLSELADQNYESNASVALNSIQLNNHDSTDNCLQWSYRALHNAGLHLVAALNKQNIQPAARVAFFVPNGIEWAILLWSCVLGKFTQAALDPGMLSPPRSQELQNILDTIRPDVIVVPDKEGASAVDLALAKRELPHPSVKLVLALRTGSESANSCSDQHPSSILPNSAPTLKQSSLTWTSFAAFSLSLGPLDPAAKSTIEAAARYDDLTRPFWIFFTSGTSTGVPKGCPRTVASVLFTIVCQAWGSLSDAPCRQTASSSQSEQANRGKPVPRNIVASQNFRIIAPALAACTWNLGGAVIMPSVGPNPGALLKAITRFEPTMVLFIPASLHATINHPSFHKANIDSLKAVLLGGDMVTKDHYVKAANAFPTAEVIIGHGMTEGGSAFHTAYMGRAAKSILEDENKNIVPFHNSIATLGKVNLGTRLRFASADGTSNLPVRRGELGELHFSNISFVRAYLNNVHPENFYEETDSEGKTLHWFKTGDLGIIDEQGWIWILGRKKDVIKRAGIPIIPAALESCLDEFLSGRSAILGLPHPVLGQEPFAVVESLTSADGTLKYSKDEVKQRIVDIFGSEYALGGIATLDDLGMVDFPINATQKIVKRELEAPVAGWVIANADVGKTL